MKFHISHKTDGVYQALLVEATTQEIAEAYFKEKKPDSRFIGIHEARSEDFKPGKPVMVVPDWYGKAVQGQGPSAKGQGEVSLRDDLNGGLRSEDSARMLKIKEHQRAFNEKMRELEKLGFRSGGWDEKTDKTAIVKVGEREIDNRIVGYMDRNLNIEWETKVLSVSRADAHYLEGTVIVEGEVYPFDYNVENEGVELHCYSEPGWMTGASYEKPLPEVVTKNMDEILSAIDDSVQEFLEEEEFCKLQSGTIDKLIDGAKAKADNVKTNERELEMDM